MATVREGNRAALVIVDVQVGVVQNAWERSRIVENIAQAVARARTAEVPVVWVQHADQELVQDSPEWQWVPELVPAESELRIHKQYNSSFEDTSLEAELAARGITHLVLAGAATNWCIRATAYGALDRGYDLTLLSDAHTTKTMEFDDGSTIQASDIVRELNIGVRWLAYPGRRNSVARAAEVEFAA